MIGYLKKQFINKGMADGSKTSRRGSNVVLGERSYEQVEPVRSKKDNLRGSILNPNSTQFSTTQQ